MESRAESSPATAEEGTPRLRTRANAWASQPDQVPAGVRAIKAAYEYLDATYESPGTAALQWGVERQHVNYYVRRLTASGVQRSAPSVSVASRRSAAESEPVADSWVTLL